MFPNLLTREMAVNMSLCSCSKSYKWAISLPVIVCPCVFQIAHVQRHLRRGIVRVCSLFPCTFRAGVHRHFRAGRRSWFPVQSHRMCCVSCTGRAREKWQAIPPVCRACTFYAWKLVGDHVCFVPRSINTFMRECPAYIVIKEISPQKRSLFLEGLTALPRSQNLQRFDLCFRTFGNAWCTSVITNFFWFFRN